jgi:hypothetical protein
MPEPDPIIETSPPQRPTDAEATAPSGPPARPPADPHAGSAPAGRLRPNFFIRLISVVGGTPTSSAAPPGP